jgi:hypothetical protein
MKKGWTLFTGALLACAISASPALAFSDLDAAEKGPILLLKDRGIVSGQDSEHFAPKGPISYAETVSMLVKGFGLNMDGIRFIKQPLASDYYTNVPNDAWYAESFIVARMNGLDISKDVDPNASITREQYVNLLVTALETKGKFPSILMLILFADDDQIDPLLQGAMQRLYLYHIAELGADRMAYPKREMTRGEAAVLLSNAIQFVEKRQEQAPEAQPGNIMVNVQPVNADVNKVTLSAGQAANAVVDIAITGIRFQQDGTAVVTYTLTGKPQSNQTEAQDTAKEQAATYIPSLYNPVVELDQSPGHTSGSQPIH